MMTVEMVMEMLEALGQDVDVYTRQEDELEVHVTVCDFAGFDEDWCEVEADYDEDAVEAVHDTLEETCVSWCGDFYHYFQFEGFSVVWGYESFEV